MSNITIGQIEIIEDDIKYIFQQIVKIDEQKKELIQDEYYYIKSTELRHMRKLYNNDILHLNRVLKKIRTSN
jgi:hypothetical protein